MMAMFLNRQKLNVNTFLCKGFNFIVCNHVSNTSKTQGAYNPKLNLHKTCKLAQTYKHMWPHNTCTCRTTLIKPLFHLPQIYKSFAFGNPCMIFLNGKIWHLTHNHVTTPHVLMGAITIKRAKKTHQVTAKTL